MDSHLHILMLPEFIIEKIISYVPNRWNVSFTCKSFYEIVCHIERFKYFLKIEGSKHSFFVSTDEDSMFNSIIKTNRLLNEIKMDFMDFFFSNFYLQGQQVDRIVEIHKKFGANIISIVWTAVQLTVDDAIRLLHIVPKLKSLTITMGKIREHATGMRVELPPINSLQIMMVEGFYKIVNLLPNNSVVNSNTFTNDESLPLVRDFLTKQESIKSLEIWFPINSTFIKHLQLDKLGLNKANYTTKQVINILQCQPNLKAISFENCISGNTFKWICENCKQLEKLEAHVNEIESIALTNLQKLRNLQRFKTVLCDISDLYGANSNSVTSLRIDDNEDLDLMKDQYHPDFRILSRNFPNLIDIEVPLDSLGQLSLLLRHFRNLTKLKCWIENPSKCRIGESIHPNVKYLEVTNDDDEGYKSMIVDIVRRMPNLSHLNVNISLMFDSKLMNEFIADKTSKLESFDMTMFIFNDDFAIGKSFLEMMRSLNNKFKRYHITFKTNRGLAYFEILRSILSKEFKVKIIKTFAPHTITLYKGGKAPK